MTTLAFALLVTSVPKFETLFFVTSDCPISRRFTPEIKRIMVDYSAISSFVFVYEDENASLSKVKAHHREFGLNGPFMLDPKRKLVKQYQVKGVPTAVVRSLDGKAQYFGRIDDSYGNDFKWRPAKHRDLRDALSTLGKGKKPVVTKTTVIGCALNN